MAISTYKHYADVLSRISIKYSYSIEPRTVKVFPAAHRFPPLQGFPRPPDYGGGHGKFLAFEAVSIALCQKYRFLKVCSTQKGKQKKCK